MIFVDKICVLWRQPDAMALWGIPHAMKDGQSPYDLWRSTSLENTAARAAGHYGAVIVSPGPREGWIWLGQPGWWGSMSAEDQGRVKAWLAVHRDLVPSGPGEWSTIVRCLVCGHSDYEHNHERRPPEYRGCKLCNCTKDASEIHVDIYRGDWRR